MRGWDAINTDNDADEKIQRFMIMLQRFIRFRSPRRKAYCNFEVMPVLVAGELTVTIRLKDTAHSQSRWNKREKYKLGSFVIGSDSENDDEKCVYTGNVGQKGIAKSELCLYS